jgi:hypothetical protein
MMTYLQVKAERALLTSALVTVWGTLIVAQGAVLMLYPLYRIVIYRREPPTASPLAESS